MMKKAVWIGITLLVLIFLGGLSLPMMASTSFGKKVIVSILSKKMKGNLKVGSWHLTWFGPQVIQSTEFQSNQLEFSFTKFRADLPFWSLFSFSQFEKSLLHTLDGELELLHADLSLHPLHEPSAHFADLNGLLSGSKGQDINLTLSGNTQIQNIKGSLNVEANINSIEEVFSRLPLFIKINLASFPTIGLDRWTHSLKLKKRGALFRAFKQEKEFLSNVLGETLNFDLTFSSKENTGNLQTFIKAPYFEANLDAFLAKQYLYLNEPILAIFQLTPFISQYFIKDVNPLFITGVEGLNPITLKISPQGFSFPLDPFSINNLFIENATLDMGKIRCTNGGTLSLILALIKLHSFAKVEQMNVWFTPVNIQVKDGILSTDRMDALIADEFHVCTWGDINLANKKLDMILGLPTKTLERSFQIKDLPPNYVMQIPLTGTTQDPDLNAKILAAKIAALIAAQKASETTLGLSDFFKLFGSTDEMTPPPKRPFPWE